MMPQSRYPVQATTPAHRVAQNRFVNRIVETERVLALLRAPAGSPAPLIMFYGAGGAGKSSLLRHLAEACEDADIVWALVDLAQAHTPAQALACLAADLRSRFGLQFPGFQRMPAELIRCFAADLVTALGSADGGSPRA